MITQRGFVVRDSRNIEECWVQSPGYYTKNLATAKTWVTRKFADNHVNREKQYNKYLVVKEITVTVDA